MSDAKLEAAPDAKAAERHLIRPYGDRKDDGVVQLSFVLPVPVSAKAKAAAEVFVKKMGFSNVLISCMEKAGDTNSFFVAYGRSGMYVDFATIEVHEPEHPKHGFDELNELILRDFGRKLAVVGGCIGTDAHAVGIDAIMNMKGYAGDYGLERYAAFNAVNLGAQVEFAALLDKAQEIGADAVLVSKVVTQRDIHKEDARNLLDLAKQRGMYGKCIFLFGGPRVDHKTATELGYDAGFGPGTKPSDVANFIYYRMLEKRKAGGASGVTGVP